MPAKKYQLSTKGDKMTGSSGNDLFVAAYGVEGPTLSAADRLNGGKGLDTIRADIGEVVGAPVMKSIEVGIFDLVTGTSAIDLKNAHQMHKITIEGAEGTAAMMLTVDNAKAVDTIRVHNGDVNDGTEVYGLDSKVHDTLSLQLSDTLASIGCFTVSGKPFKAVELTLSDAIDSTLWGGALSARDLTIHSLGINRNQLTYNPGQYTGTVRHLTIDGTINLTLFNSGNPEIFQHLYSVDLTGMKALSQLTIGGEKLTSVLCGAGRDLLAISDLGGSEKHKAEIDLGADFDIVTLLEGVYDPATQHFDGGKGWDSFGVVGATADLWKGITNFEQIDIYNATGTYDLNGLDVTLYLDSANGAVTLDRVNDGSKIVLQDDLTTFLTVNIENAGASQAESVSLFMGTGVTTYGNAVVGLIAPDLSQLALQSLVQEHVFYLTTIGSATDGATISIGGDGPLILRATTGSTSYIEELIVTGSAGVDLSGLANADRAFVTTGVTIVGGAGDDVLWGGIGFDTISTGGGDNTVLGSLGQDEITLSAGSGLDRIKYEAFNESTFSLGHDTILNFGFFDAIDVSGIGDVAFMGNFADNASGIATLSTSVARAFFNTTTDTLYIDLDHDKALGSNHDMQIVLTGLESFASSNLIS